MALQLGPHELQHVFSFLEARDLLRAAQVNKVWNEVSMTNELWRQLCLRRWAPCKALPVVLGTQTWRQYYFCRSELEFRVKSGRPQDFICKAISGHTGTIDQLAYVSPHEYRFDEKARLVHKGMSISRPNAVVGRCRMIRHSRDKKNEPNPQRFDRIAHTKETMRLDGLNSLTYQVLDIQRYPLYTKITVDIGTPR